MDSIVKREPDGFVQTQNDRLPIITPTYISGDGGDEDEDSGCSDGASDDGQCIRATALRTGAGAGAGASASKPQKTRSLKEIDHDSALKKPKLDKEVVHVAVPVNFLAPLPPCSPVEVVDGHRTVQARAIRRQFWKSGDYEWENNRDVLASRDVGMDRVRVHLKFLHSNATSHKWALGAFAELLDNALDEVCNGATYVHIDLLENKRKNSLVLVIEDNGGGMTPDKMRQCMSLGYSAKSKAAKTIDGNGFKTITMRLGADVIDCILTEWEIRRNEVDYKKKGQQWSKIIGSSTDDWNRNFGTILHWSPFESEEELLQQDIQIRGVHREEKKIKTAKRFLNSRHFLTYRHSLRSYASILYLRLPPDFRIILRGKDVKHHNLVNGMMLSQKITYKPLNVAESASNDSTMVANVTIGFVKDASFHIDVQGFNVYHKNRLVKPFWRVWNATGSDGRGIIGVLEANFIEPARDKQDLERTIVLSRLEARLVVMQRNYRNTNCHHVGYAARRPSKKPVSCQTEGSSKSKSCSSSVGKEKGVISPCSTLKLDAKQREASMDLDESSEDRSSSPANVHGQQAMACNFKIGPLGRASQTTLKEGEETIKDIDKEQTALIGMLVKERTEGEWVEDERRDELTDD